MRESEGAREKPTRQGENSWLSRMAVPKLDNERAAGSFEHFVDVIDHPPDHILF